MSYYTWITDRVAIGELNACYHGFDIIINLAYINPSFNKGLEHRQHRKSVNDNSLLIEIGLWDSDCDADYITDALKMVFNEIREYRDVREYPKILFHCQSGKSRSVTFALVYLSKVLELSVSNTLEKIKEKRPNISPREECIDYL